MRWLCFAAHTHAAFVEVLVSRRFLSHIACVLSEVEVGSRGWCHIDSRGYDARRGARKFAGECGCLQETTLICGGEKKRKKSLC